MALLTIYADDHYHGKLEELNESSPALQLNDALTSFHLVQSASAIFYANVNYDEEMFRVPGGYSYDCTATSPLDNDRVSSIRLFQDKEFKSQL